MIFGEWTRAFEVEVPLLVEEFCKDIAKTWSEYVVELGEHIKSTAPNLGGHFSEEFSNLIGISGEFCAQVEREIDTMTDKARRTQNIFGDSIRADLAPIFAEALEDKGEFSPLYPQLLIIRIVKMPANTMEQEAEASGADRRSSANRFARNARPCSGWRSTEWEQLAIKTPRSFSAS